jgi:hypothetical protein
MFHLSSSVVRLVLALALLGAGLGHSEVLLANATTPWKLSLECSLGTLHFNDDVMVKIGKKAGATYESKTLTSPRPANAAQMSQVFSPPVRAKSAAIIASRALANLREARGAGPVLVGERLQLRWSVWSTHEGLQGCNFIPSMINCTIKVLPCIGTRGAGLPIAST